MADALVTVDGWPLRRWGVVSDVESTSLWRVGGYSGTRSIALRWSAPVRFSAPWLRYGAVLRIIAGGVVVAEGRVSEVVPGEPWTIAAEGYGEALEFTPVVEGVTVVTAADVANRSATQFLVNAAGTTSAPPTGYQRTFVVRPGQADLGPDASALVTGVSVLYATAVSNGTPTAVAITTPTASASLDTALEAKFGARRRTIDATALGVLSSGAAQTIAADRMTAGGRRLGWSGTVSLDRGQVLAANGGPADPLTIRAGDKVRVPGLSDPRSQVLYDPSVTVTLGEVTRYWSQGRAVGKPVGAVDRDLASLFASIPKPADEAGITTL